MDALQHIAARLHAFYVEGWADVLRSLAVAIGLVICVLLLELTFVSWRDSSLRRLMQRSATVRTDALAFFLVETNLGLFIGMAMFFGVTYLVQRQVVAIGATVGPWRIGSPWLVLVVYFVVNDLANYWTHRLCHQVPMLWHIHRYHHSAPEMTVLTAARDHPMERAFASLVSAVPAALLAVPAEQFLVLMLLAKAVGLLKHSNLMSTWGWFGRFVIQSPAAHRIHHSIDPVHHNRNFASLFQFWDVLFRTAYNPRPDEARAVRLGVEGDDGQTPALRYLMQIFVGFARFLPGVRRV